LAHWRYVLARLRLGGAVSLGRYFLMSIAHRKVLAALAAIWLGGGIAILQGQGVSVLGSQKLTAFVSTHDPARAKTFYRDTLGLRLLSEDSFALVFDANGTKLRVSIVPEVALAKYTVLGWEVPDIIATAKSLQKAGVKLEIFGGFPQDELGIWKAPDGTRVAWFKDPDGNILSIAQH
jgi:catechol 2,3-dioxygenase-like lactoylglutathione lyase family enzyme